MGDPHQASAIEIGRAIRGALTTAIPETAQDTALAVLVDQRARFHVAFRTYLRLLQAIDPAGGAHTPKRRVALAGFITLDAVSGVFLARDRRFRLLPRLLADSVDTAWWSLRQ